jgi:acetyl-CoA acyltransferase
MSDVVIAGYARSPFTPARRGDLARVRPDDLAAQVVKALIERSGIDPQSIEDVILGCAFPEGEQGLNAGRLVALLAGLPISVAGTTVNRFCGSSMQSVHMAAGAIHMGAGDAFVCAGVESMSRVPMQGFNPMPNPAMRDWAPSAYISMGETAENVAGQFAVTREAQEAFAVASHNKAAAASGAGRLADEIVSIETKSGGVNTDGCIRADTSLEGLAGLKPAFLADGSVTAGTSSPLTDGAAAILVTSAAFAQANGLTAFAKIKAIGVAGCDPATMGMGPVLATAKALKRAGLSVNDLDVIELNEAFASQALACISELGLNPDRVNLDGGAVALGHPLGATGARITGKAAALLAREGGRYALATQCIGGGQGIATVLEAV